MHLISKGFNMTYFKFAATATALTAMLSTSAFAGNMKSFTALDANADGSVDFTEFYNAYQGKSWSDTDIAVKFQKFTNGNDSFTEADYKTAAILDSAVTTQPVSMTSEVSSEFSAYDANSDGQVNFKEYAKASKKKGITSTAAAQQFIRISDGRQTFNASQFDLAMMTDALERPVFKSVPNDLEALAPTYTASSATSASATTTVALDSEGLETGRDVMTETSTPEAMIGTAEPKVIVQTPEVEIDTDVTTGMTLDPNMSNMTNSGTETDMEKSNNPQMDVWGTDEDEIN